MPSNTDYITGGFGQLPEGVKDVAKYNEEYGDQDLTPYEQDLSDQISKSMHPHDEWAVRQFNKGISPQELASHVRGGRGHLIDPSDPMPPLPHPGSLLGGQELKGPDMPGDEDFVPLGRGGMSSPMPRAKTQREFRSTLKAADAYAKITAATKPSGRSKTDDLEIEDVKHKNRMEELGVTEGGKNRRADQKSSDAEKERDFKWDALTQKHQDTMDEIDRRLEGLAKIKGSSGKSAELKSLTQEVDVLETQITHAASQPWAQLPDVQEDLQQKRAQLEQSRRALEALRAKFDAEPDEPTEPKPTPQRPAAPRPRPSQRGAPQHFDVPDNGTHLGPAVPFRVPVPGQPGKTAPSNVTSQDLNSMFRQ